MKKQDKKTKKVKNISTYTHQGLRASWTIHGMNNEDKRRQKVKNISTYTNQDLTEINSKAFCDLLKPFQIS